jgi:pimeloyl-ACP methyl ester carboxylesterase
MRTTVAVDLRGHGLSNTMSGSDFSMDLFADDIAKTLDVIGAAQADLAGLSMGGYVLFSFWRRHPDRVRSLILIDTKAEADTDEGKAGREKTAELVAEKGMQPLYETLGPKVVGSSPSVEVQDKIKEMFLNTAPEVAAADSLAMRDRADSTGDLASIKVPVLWMHGEEDTLMPLEGARASAEKLSDATFVSIPKGGHVSPMENPEAVNAAITNFLKTE